MKTLIVQNYWTPYRHELFTEMSKYTDIGVLYLGDVGGDRLWKKEKCSFPSIQLEAKKLGPFLFSSLKGIDLSGYNQLVLLEHLENIFTILKLAALFKGRFILWTGMAKDAHPEKPGYDLFTNIIKHWYRKRIYLADHFFAYSELSREMLLNYGIKDEKITIIHQASRIRELPEIINRDPVDLRKGRSGPLKLLSLGYLRKEKNNDLLIKVCSRFSEKEVELFIVGDGPERENLVAMAGRNVHFKGYMEGEDKFREYMAADVFVLPTIRDPWALVVNEAMYYGLPIICSERAGARDMVKDNGFIINPFDEEDLYEAIQKLVGNRPLCEKMGRRSRQIVKDYTIPFAAVQMAGLLEAGINQNE